MKPNPVDVQGISPQLALGNVLAIARQQAQVSVKLSEMWLAATFRIIA